MGKVNWIDSQSDNNLWETRPCAPQAAPPSFLRHQFRHSWTVDAPVETVWSWLNDPDTFTSGQVPPYRVEFASADIDVPRGFQVGGLNMHHGPGLLASGTLVELVENSYRDLQYFYGSYILSVRLVRPTRLQFWVEPKGAGTLVRVHFDTLVQGWFDLVWDVGCKSFWWMFSYWMRKALQSGRPR